MNLELHSETISTWILSLQCLHQHLLKQLSAVSWTLIEHIKHFDTNTGFALVYADSTKYIYYYY